MESSYAIEDILQFEMQGKFGGAKLFTSKQNVSFLNMEHAAVKKAAQHGKIMMRLRESSILNSAKKNSNCFQGSNGAGQFRHNLSGPAICIPTTSC